MSNDSPDVLVTVYRMAARETASVMMDDRVLRFARQRELRGLRSKMIGLALAIAAAAVLWLTVQRESGVTPSYPLGAATTSAGAGYTEGRSQAYLMQMDVRPPDSPVTQYLRHHSP